MFSWVSHVFAASIYVSLPQGIQTNHNDLVFEDL